jgi:hypothetical protein
VSGGARGGIGLEGGICSFLGDDRVKGSIADRAREALRLNLPSIQMRAVDMMLETVRSLACICEYTWRRRKKGPFLYAVECGDPSRFPRRARLTFSLPPTQQSALRAYGGCTV